MEDHANCFARWAKRGVWEKVFVRCADDDLGSLIDSTVVRAHQHAAGGKGGPMQCSGPLSRRFFVQFHDHHQRREAAHIILTPGQQQTRRAAAHLIKHATGKALVADAGYDSDAIVGAVRQRGMKPVIAMNPTRKHNRRRKSRALYRLRGNVERFFHDIKRFRAIASRYEKTATNFLAAVHVACILVWLN